MSVPCGSTRKGVRVTLTWNRIVQRHRHWLGGPIAETLGYLHHVRGIPSSRGIPSQKTDDAPGDVIFPLMRMWKSCWQRVDVLVIWNVYCLTVLYGPQMKNIGWLFISRQQQMPCCKWKSYIYWLGYTSMFGDAATKFGLDQITCLQSNS